MTSAYQVRDRIANLRQQLQHTRENSEVLEKYARTQAQLQEAEAQLADLQGRLSNARGEMQEASEAAPSILAGHCVRAEADHASCRVACMLVGPQRLTRFTDAVETLAHKLSSAFTEYMEGMGAGGEIVLVTEDGDGEHRVKRPIKDWEMLPHVRFRCVLVVNVAILRLRRYPQRVVLILRPFSPRCAARGTACQRCRACGTAVESARSRPSCT